MLLIVVAGSISRMARLLGSMTLKCEATLLRVRRRGTLCLYAFFSLLILILFDVRICLAQGGAIYAAGNNKIDVALNQLSLNTAAQGGGAIYAIKGSLRLQSMTLAQNSAQDGGGVYLKGCDAELAAAVFDRNMASRDGGAGLLQLTPVVATNCDFVNNTAGSKGGAFAILGETFFVADTTCQANKARNGGCISLTSATVIANSVVRFHGNIDQAMQIHSTLVCVSVCSYR